MFWFFLLFCLFDGSHGWKNNNQLKRNALKYKNKKRTHTGKELEAHWVEKGRLTCDSDVPQVGSARSDWTGCRKCESSQNETLLYLKTSICLRQLKTTKNIKVKIVISESRFENATFIVRSSIVVSSSAAIQDVSVAVCTNLNSDKYTCKSKSTNESAMTYYSVVWNVTCKLNLVQEFMSWISCQSTGDNKASVSDPPASRVPS
jgi:hypothetical protein